MSGGYREGHLLSGHSVVKDQETEVRLPEMQGLWDRTARYFPHSVSEIERQLERKFLWLVTLADGLAPTPKLQINKQALAGSCDLPKVSLART